MNESGSGYVIESLAVKTVQRVHEALAHSETACVTQVLEIVQELSQKADRLSVQDLASLIGRDLTTVTKIMKAAACLGYNPSAVEVTTLPEAIAVIGYEKIRNLVLSLLLIETAEGRNCTKESKEVAALALTAGLTAQAIIAQCTSINPEQAFVCAALRQYGKLLLSSFLPDKYKEALELGGVEFFDSACGEVLGLDALELGRRILTQAQLPKAITGTLQPAPQQVVRSAGLSEADRLLVVSEFASKVCELISAPATTAEKYQEGLAELLKTYVRSVAMTEKDLKGTLESVGKMIGTFGRAQGFDGFSSLLISRMRALAEDAPWVPAPGCAPTARPPVRAQPPPVEAVRAPDPFLAELSEIERLTAATPRDARQIFEHAVRAVRAALRLQSCLVFLQEQGGTLFAAAVGSGALFDEIRYQSLLDPARRDVFTVCLERGEDAVIQNPEDPKIAPFIPEWFKRSGQAGPFVLLPVQDGAGTFAILCGVVLPGQPVELNATRRQQLQTLRGCLGQLRP